MLRENLGLSYIGVLICDYLGDPCTFEDTFIFLETNSIAKAIALLHGLALAKRGGHHHIHIEGDSFVIIRACIDRHYHN